MREIWDIYDGNRVLTGKTHLRGIPLVRGDYHIVVDIWAINDRGEILLTKRHPKKPNGGLWECTGGSVVAGEDSITGAKRELSEETGIQVKETELHFLGSMKRKNSFLDTYLVKKTVPLQNLRLQDEEVTDAKWVTEYEFETLSAEHKTVPAIEEAFRIYRNKIMSFL